GGAAGAGAGAGGRRAGTGDPDLLDLHVPEREGPPEGRPVQAAVRAGGAVPAAPAGAQLRAAGAPGGVVGGRRGAGGGGDARGGWFRGVGGGWRACAGRSSERWSCSRATRRRHAWRSRWSIPTRWRRQCEGIWGCESGVEAGV